MAKILIVDDDPMSIDLLRCILERSGHFVVSHTSGCGAIIELRNNSFDLITLDLMMPIMDGYETLNIIRRFCTTPVLIVTSLSEFYYPEKFDQLQKMGIPFLSKPIMRNELVKKIEEIFEKL